jgi:hypothetical protein
MRVASSVDFRADGFFVSFEQPVRQHLVPRSVLPKCHCTPPDDFNGSALLGPSTGGMLIPYIGTGGCFFAAVVGNLLVLDLSS